MKKTAEIKKEIDERVNGYMSSVYLKTDSQRNLIEFRVGICLLILADIFSLAIFKARSREKFVVISVVVMIVLHHVAVMSKRNGEIRQSYYAVSFATAFVFGLYLFIMGDNTRGVIMFGLLYPVLSIYILKSYWGNLLIACAFAASLICDEYINPLKMSSETRSLYICMYIMIWLISLTTEKTKSYLETNMKEQQKLLARLASSDPLTKLLNRRSFYERLDLKEQAEPGKRNVTVLMLDVDNFKSINDTYGHGVGDEVLREVAERIKGMTRSGDLCCRWGGEEFVLLAETQNEKGSQVLASKVCDGIGKSDFFLADGRKLHVTVSVGAVFIENFEKNMTDDVVKTADEMLYLAKKQGKNRVQSGIFDNSGKK